MNRKPNVLACSLLAGLFFLPALAGPGQPAVPGKIKVVSQTDLPRFTYPVTGPASGLLSLDDAAFAPFLAKVQANLQTVLDGYDIQDRAAQRTWVGLELSLEVLRGDNQAALATLGRLRELQDKPGEKLTTGLATEAILRARLRSGGREGADFQAEAARFYGEAVDRLPWDQVQDLVKEQRQRLLLNSAAMIEGGIKRAVDPMAAQSGTLDQNGAASVVSARLGLRTYLPLAPAFAAALKRYIEAHNVVKPDIWAAREVVLGTGAKATPVRIGIWDSGVDTSLFKGQLYTDPQPGAHSPHGLAFDFQGALSASDLEPLPEDLKREGPFLLDLIQGMDDVRSQVDSPEAARVRELTAHTPSGQLAEIYKKLDVFGNALHGTHVAGIAVAGNAAARLVVARFNDNISNLPFAPTPAWARTFAADFEAMGDYFRTHHVRVVNMSWGDTVEEFEESLAKTSPEKDPAVRKKTAQEIFRIWKEGIVSALRRAPGTLFVAAAGNSNANPGFEDDAPASLRLPNLLVVGAVNQAGDETSFTSFGDTVRIHANGYRVESFVPGGRRLKESGTSMASPNVANLAGKLFALDPSLTPEKAIDLILKGSDPSPDGRIHLMNPKATVALLGK